jgi:hypothetical protein
MEVGDFVCTAGVSSAGSKVVWLARITAFDDDSGEATLTHFVPVGNSPDGGTLYKKNKPANGEVWHEHKSSLSALPPDGMRYDEGHKTWICSVDLKRLLARVDKSALDYAKEHSKKRSTGVHGYHLARGLIGWSALLSDVSRRQTQETTTEW